MIAHRVRTWLTCRALHLRCIATSHNYGRHFTDMFHDTSLGEAPWCDRCGRDEPDARAR